MFVGNTKLIRVQMANIVNYVQSFYRPTHQYLYTVSPEHIDHKQKSGNPASKAIGHLSDHQHHRENQEINK